MSKIEEVRERLELELFTSAGWRVVQCLNGDLRALLADHERLRVSHDRLLKAATYLQSRVVQTQGVRCMDEMHAAIDAAKAVKS